MDSKNLPVLFLSVKCSIFTIMKLTSAKSFSLSHPRLFTAIFAAAVFVVSIIALNFVGGDSLRYLEHWRTFYYTWGDISQISLKIGGASQLVADFLLQFFVIKGAGIIITSALMAVATLTLWKTMERIQVGRALWPLALLPVVALAVNHLNVNYLQGGTIGFIASLAALNIEQRTPFVTVAVAAVLFFLAGPVAMLFALVALINDSTTLKKGLAGLLYPLSVVTLGALSVALGWLPSLKMALTPAGYYTLTPEIAPIHIYPWIFALALLLLAAAVRALKLDEKIGKRSGRAVAVLASVALLSAGPMLGKAHINQSEETFKRLSCSARDSDWESLASQCRPLKKPNMLYRNFQNLAFAGKGILADEMFRYPCVDLRTLVEPMSRTAPPVNALNSDIYYMMGCVYEAQHLAFETFVATGNLSPRMLQRLVETNLLFSQWDVASKYLDRLSHTLFYRNWAAEKSALIGNEHLVAADPELGPLQRCVSRDFDTIYDFAGALENVVASNPDYDRAVQYLGCCHILFSQFDALESLVAAHYGGKIIPLAFEQALALYYYSTGDRDKFEKLSPEICREFEKWISSRSPEKDNVWYFIVTSQNRNEK